VPFLIKLDAVSCRNLAFLPESKEEELSMLEIVVITVSDRAFRGEYEDLSGPKIREIILASDLPARVTLTVVPDEREAIHAAIMDNLDKDFIFTTGGTGISSRDITPEVTQEICEKSLPGIDEFLRRESFKETPFAVLSRGFSGMKAKTMIINLPGSVKAVTLCTNLMLPILAHAKKMVEGGKH
jgi:molybdopterin adenylyltransferase